MTATTINDAEVEVIVTLRLRFKNGTIDHVLERLIPIAYQTRQEEGNISFDVFHAQDDNNQLILMERWKDKAALEHHWQEPYTKEILSIFESALETPLSEERDVTYLRDLMRDDQRLG